MKNFFTIFKKYKNMYWRVGGSKNKSILIINKKRFNYVTSADCWCIVLGASIGRIAEWTEEKRNMIMYSRITYLEHNLKKRTKIKTVYLTSFLTNKNVNLFLYLFFY